MDNMFHNLERHFALPEVAEVPLLRPLDWVGAGWKDLRSCPAVSLGYGFAIAAIWAVILSSTVNQPYLFMVAISGFLLIGPILAVGLYEVSRRRGAGETPTMGDALSCWRRNSASIGLFGVVLAVVALGWERLSAIMFAMLYGGTVPDLGSFMTDVFLSGHYPRLVAVYMMSGAVLAALVFIFGAVSLPMMLDRNTDPATAMMTSLKAVAMNPAPMALWAATIVFFAAIGFATFLIGMVFIMPMLGHATWHAYKELVK